MNIGQYQENASRTCPDLGSLEKNLLHMDIGIFTEMGEIADIFKKWFAYGKEIDLVHLGEEIADVAWYQINKDRFMGIIYDEHLFIPFLELNYPIENEVLMRNVINYSQLSASPIQIVYIICENFGLDFYKLLENNINKLKVRYPKKFNMADALNRNLENERKVLEQ